MCRPHVSWEPPAFELGQTFPSRTPLTHTPVPSSRKARHLQQLLPVTLPLHVSQGPHKQAEDRSVRLCCPELQGLRGSAVDSDTWPAGAPLCSPQIILPTRPMPARGTSGVVCHRPCEIRLGFWGEFHGTFRCIQGRVGIGMTRVFSSVGVMFFCFLKVRLNRRARCGLAAVFRQTRHTSHWLRSAASHIVAAIVSEGVFP